MTCGVRGNKIACLLNMFGLFYYDNEQAAWSSQ